MMLQNYHYPDRFRFNLNAFIQALRNTTFILQSEDNKPDGFEAWYAQKQEEMRSNTLLRNFVQARNVIVKQAELEAQSKCALGLFRYKKLKIALSPDLPPCIDSYVLLEKAKSFVYPLFLPLDHSAIGEQAGIERTWVFPEIGETEVVGLCIEAATEIASVVRSAIQLAGGDHIFDFEISDLYDFRVLLETDADPNLPIKWGWCE